MTYIQGVSEIHVIIGFFSDGEVAVIRAFTNLEEAMNVRDRLKDLMITPGSGVLDYQISSCIVKEPAE